MKKHLMMAIIAFLMIFVLTGCRQKTDSENAYRLPLGDAGYISEMDFDLYRVEENEEAGKSFNYDYVESNTAYTITVSTKVMDEKYDGKSYKVSVGYYKDGVYTALSDKYTNQVLFQEDFNAYAFTYNSLEITEEIKSSLVIKFEFGTNIDEEVFKSNNESYKKKDLNKYIKKYKGAVFYLNEVSINGTNIIYESATDGTKYLKENNSLYYYNTGTVSSTDNNGNIVVALKLNNKTNLWQWLIAQLGKLLFWITNLVGGYYWLGLLIFTILIRSIGWPIYAKTNSFSTNMAKVQPEIDKLNKKYEGKTDQNSKMKQQMEMREIMKKNHVSMWGCLLPFAQMPIFFAVYQVVQRFPLTPLYADVNYKFFGTTFAMDYGKASGHWLLAILVGVTMIGSQLLSTYMTKRIQRKKANFYTAKNQQNNKSMLIMMVVMTVMMVVFAWNSSGIAFYWIIGNIYQIGQTFISKLQEEKREEKAQLLSGKARGRN